MPNNDTNRRERGSLRGLRVFLANRVFQALRGLAIVGAAMRLEVAVNLAEARDPEGSFCISNAQARARGTDRCATTA